MRWLFGVALMGIVGCDRLDAALPSLSAPAPKALVASRGVETTRGRASRSVDARASLKTALPKLRQRLTFSLPAEPQLPRCEAERFDRDSRDAVTHYVDARTTTKSLLPRRVSEIFESGGIAELFTEMEGLDSMSEEELTRLEGELTVWERRRYVGVFFITEYQGPALILKVGALKRSWYPGQISARFVVFDTAEQKPLCGYTVRAENDTREAPIRSRLQAETRIRLERELARTLRESAITQLSRDVPGLKLPETLTISPVP